MNIDQFQSYVGGLDHPECVAWGPDGNVYAGGEAGQIYRITPDRKINLVATTGGFILGLCLDADANIYACDVAKNQVIKIDPHGKTTTYSAGTADRRLVSPNYALFDSQGNLYYTDSGIAGQNDSCLFRVNRDGTTELMSEEVNQTANGLAISPDEKTLYIVLSEECQVVKVTLPDAPDRALPIRVSAPEPVVKLDRAVPDGLAIDIQGSLYIGCYSPDVIYYYSKDGELSVLVEDWKRATLASPTNMTFGGIDWKTMYIANFARWDLATARMAVPGRPVNFPRL